MKYYVSKNGSDLNDGTDKAPFLTINKAASVAVAGDEVIVHEGTYRERVDPQNSGKSNHQRITYKAAENEKVTIKGSEEVKSWEKVENNIWKTIIPNSYFGEFNPYKEKIYGDWVEYNPGRHLGNVYLNGMSFYEKNNYDDLLNPQIKEKTLDHWTDKYVEIKNKEQTKYLWFVEVDDNNTTIYANFHDYDPNEEFVEINVRKYVFYPKKTGMNYITVSGFEMAQAATQWAPPTADQPGLIGAHWSKGWIIKNNVIHDAKTSGVSIGKEISTGDNFSTKRKDKPGYQYQLESVFLAREKGWSKEEIGSHKIYNNTIFDCGQNGIVGHLGCVFSEIYNNRIYNIGIKREFYGHEIAGIKLHAAIDVHIHNNYIHDCSLGTWLDWQVQGTRVSKNIYHKNARDLFIEVTNGPHIVDNNILTADYAFDNHAQGGAYINNIIAGEMIHRAMLDRPTPYHYPHSTKISGFAPVYLGDDRYHNNIFVGRENLDGVGTHHYEGYPSSFEQYLNWVHSKPGDHQAFHATKQPVYIDDNAYYNGAVPYSEEINNYVDQSFDPSLKIIEENNEVYLSILLPDKFNEIRGTIHSTNTLPKVRLVGQDFEDSLGNKLVINEDLLNNLRENNTSLGPINTLHAGENYVKVWG